MTLIELKLRLALQRAETKIARQGYHIKQLTADKARMRGVCDTCGI